MGNGKPVDTELVSVVLGVSYTLALMQNKKIVCAEVSLISVGDSEVLPTLLAPLKCKIKQASVDIAYDTKDCHEQLREKNIQLAIPPIANPGYWVKHHPRSDTCLVLKR